MTWAIHEGDALTVLRGMPDGRFHACVTSPPYWGLRDYGTATWVGGEASCEHAGRPKPRQDTSGGGPTKDRFAETRGTQAGKRAYSVCVRDVCPCGARRIDQQLGLELTPEVYVKRLVRVFREVRRVLREDGALWLNLGDSYCSDHTQESTRLGNYGLHEKISGSVAHKRRGSSGALKPKDLVGIPWRLAFALQADGWWLRSEVIWHKPNPMPESVRDRPTKAHEQLFLLAKSERYYYDGEPLREPLRPKTLTTFGSQRRPSGDGTGLVKSERLGDTMPERNPRLNDDGSHAGANARTVWTIGTQPFTGAHFATFPRELARRCVLSACPPGGTVLDPFAGAGTTLMVAARLGRHSEGIELNPTYAEMARRRIESDAPLFNTQEVTA